MLSPSRSGRSASKFLDAIPITTPTRTRWFAAPPARCASAWRSTTWRRAPGRDSDQPAAGLLQPRNPSVSRKNGFARRAGARAGPSPRRWWWIAAAGIAVVASVAAIMFVPLLHRTDLDRFWAPVVDAVLPGGGVRGTAQSVQARTRHAAGSGSLDRENLRTGKTRPRPPRFRSPDLKPMWDRNVSLVDVAGDAASVSALDAEGQKDRNPRRTGQFPGRSARKACILIGAFNNDWTMRLTSDLRFYFDHGSDPRIHGHSGPPGRQPEGLGRIAQLARASGSRLGLRHRFPHLQSDHRTNCRHRRRSQRLRNLRRRRVSGQ